MSRREPSTENRLRVSNYDVVARGRARDPFCTPASIITDTAPKRPSRARAECCPSPYHRASEAKGRRNPSTVFEPLPCPVAMMT